MRKAFAVALGVATVMATPAHATQQVYSFEGTPRQGYPDFVRSYGTITVPEDFQIQQIGPYYFRSPNTGKLEIFGERADGVVLRGMIHFGAIIIDRVSGSPETSASGFLVGGALGGLSYFGKPISEVVGSGASKKLFDLTEFSTVIVNVGGQEDNSNMFGPGTLQASFNIVSIRSGAAVPEPATWAMMVLGFGMVGYAMRRRQKAVVRFV